jgi:hypothetical protein
MGARYGGRPVGCERGKPVDSVSSPQAGRLSARSALVLALDGRLGIEVLELARLDA